VEELKQEDAERRKREAKYLELGKKAYEFGEYPTSVEYLERAVEDCGRETSYGGEALMWLALAYQVGPPCLLPAVWLGLAGSGQVCSCATGCCGTGGGPGVIWGSSVWQVGAAGCIAWQGAAWALAGRGVGVTKPRPWCFQVMKRPDLCHPMVGLGPVPCHPCLDLMQGSCMLLV
jgi:hypothetical protein